MQNRSEGRKHRLGLRKPETETEKKIRVLGFHFVQNRSVGREHRLGLRKPEKRNRREIRVLGFRVYKYM